MTLKRKLISLFFWGFMFLTMNGIICQAQTLSENKNCYVHADADNNYKYVKIHMSNPGILRISFKAKFKNETAPVIQQSIGLFANKVVYNEYFSEQDFAEIDVDNASYSDMDTYYIEWGESQDILYDCFYDKKGGYTYFGEVDTEQLEDGDYIFSFMNATGYEWNLDYSFTWYSGYADNMILPSAVTFKEGSNYWLKPVVQPSNSILAINGIYGPNIDNLNIEINRNRILISAEKAGNYVLNLRLLNGKKYSINLRVTKAVAPKIKYEKYTVSNGECFTNKILYNSERVLWSSSNSQIAAVNQNGKVLAKKVGSCSIIARVGKKKYTCTVKVIPSSPDFFARITGYNRAGNYFTTRIKNNTKKSLVIYSSNSEAVDSKYPVYDRKLKLLNNKNITLKANEEKSVKFYVQGSRTWYDYTDFAIVYKIKFDGKSYGCIMESLFSEYLDKDKKTYSDSEAFYQWAG